MAFLVFTRISRFAGQLSWAIYQQSFNIKVKKVIFENPRKQVTWMAILAECPICHRKQFWGQKQAKNEGFGGNSVGKDIFYIKQGFKYSDLNPCYYYGTPGWVRTSGFQLRRLTLYPLSYGRLKQMSEFSIQKTDVKNLIQLLKQVKMKTLSSRGTPN